MEKCYTYILFSKKLDKFYTGSTRLSASERQERHLSEYYGDTKFTSKADDWILYYEIECRNITQAIMIENHIKRMKSKTYIKNLAKYPEMVEKLLKKYSHKPDC